MLLFEMFQKIDELQWNYALYLSKDLDWTADSECLILDPEETDDPDDDPDLAKEKGMRYVLIVQDVQSIVENAKSQLGLLTVEEFIDALKFYFNNDAYIEFDQKNQ